MRSRGSPSSSETVRAVDGLNLTLEKGGIFGFLGQNGAGKTTTLRMVANLARPTAGEISICGRKVEFGSEQTNAFIGYLPDVPQFYDWMRPMEYLVLCGRLMGMNATDAAKRAKELLEMVGLAGAKRSIKGFSRGMKQRLGIAQALVHNPAAAADGRAHVGARPASGARKCWTSSRGWAGSTRCFSPRTSSPTPSASATASAYSTRAGWRWKARWQEIGARYSTKGAVLEIADASRHGELLAGVRRRSRGSKT